MLLLLWNIYLLDMERILIGPHLVLGLVDMVHMDLQAWNFPLPDKEHIQNLMNLFPQGKVDIQKAIQRG